MKKMYITVALAMAMMGGCTSVSIPGADLGVSTLLTLAYSLGSVVVSSLLG